MSGPICVVVGARPNFVKMASVCAALAGRSIEHVLIHTGQHYDRRMSEVFFEELGMRSPDRHLGVGPGSHAQQTARIMISFEEAARELAPCLVVVGGDVNSTVACALAAAKEGIPVAHVEAGLRSFDRRMPEEINRVVTDHLCELLFTTEPSGEENLRREGIEGSRIHFVGNTMIDSLTTHIATARGRAPWRAFDLEPGGYAVATLHRPSNVDEPQRLAELLAAFDEIGGRTPVLFPVHPRTRERLASMVDPDHVRLAEPLGYLDFLGMMSGARLVLTDSGGIQEETTALGVPCFTLRENTERPITVSEGTNRLVHPDRASLLAAVAALDDRGGTGAGRIPRLWDGHAGQRVADIIGSWLSR